MSPPVHVLVASADPATRSSDAFAVREALWRNGDGGNGVLETVLIQGGLDRTLDWLAEGASRSESRRCLVVSAELDAESALTLLHGGADGVLTRPDLKWLLRQAIAVVGKGGLFLDPWVAHEVADLVRPRRGNLQGVTGSEQRILLHAARGMDVPATAAAIGVSPDTVKGHLRSAQHRLGVGRRELVRTARDLGVLPTGTTAAAQTWDTTRGLHGLSLFVVAPERLPRETLMGTLRAAGAQIVGHGAGADAAAAAAGEWEVTLVLSRDAEEAIAVKSASPHAGLVVVPWLMNTRTMHRALAARAQAVVGVDAHLDELIVGLRLAAAGGLYLHTSALRLVLKGIEPPHTAHIGPLTMRQRDVLALAGQGFSNREIARELGLAEPTVKGHVRGALRLLDAASRREAAERARGLGWLDAG